MRAVTTLAPAAVVCNWIVFALGLAFAGVLADSTLGTGPPIRAMSASVVVLLPTAISLVLGSDVARMVPYVVGGALFTFVCWPLLFQEWDPHRRWRRPFYWTITASGLWHLLWLVNFLTGAPWFWAKKEVFSLMGGNALAVLFLLGVAGLANRAPRVYLEAPLRVLAAFWIIWLAFPYFGELP